MSSIKNPLRKIEELNKLKCQDLSNCNSKKKPFQSLRLRVKKAKEKLDKIKNLTSS